MSDIDPEAEAHLGDGMVVATLRQWTPERRAAVACRLTAMVRASSRAAWRRQHPDEPQRAVDIAWAEAQYGPDIGARLRAWYADRP
jgi:hypothetical protein